MFEKVLGKKIELMPKELIEGKILCDECGGTGWLMKEKNGLRIVLTVITD